MWINSTDKCNWLKRFDSTVQDGNRGRWEKLKSVVNIGQQFIHCY